VQRSPFSTHKRPYYYLVAGLPALVLEQGKVPFSSRAFLDEIRPHLHPDDLAQCKLLFLETDNTNLLSLLQRRDSWKEDGNFSRGNLEEGLREPESLPYYMARFIKAYQEETPLLKGMSWENQLTTLFYDYLLSRSTAFLRAWFSFDRDVRNVLIGLGARKHGFSLEGQLIGEYELTEAIRQSRARDFGVSASYPLIEALLQIEEEASLLDKELAIDQLRWSFLEEQNTFNYFTIEVLIAFLIRLQLLERWSLLDPDRGAERFEALVRELETSFEFPNEFSI
jgi:hypothetical protein